MDLLDFKSYNDVVLRGDDLDYPKYNFLAHAIGTHVKSMRRWALYLPQPRLWPRPSTQAKVKHFGLWTKTQTNPLP